MTAQLSLPLDVSPWSGYQSRYVAYCLAHGAESPEEMTARDREEYPGGAMAGYMCWIGSKWREWRECTGYHAEHLLTEHHAAFDTWLAGATPGEEKP